VTFDSHLTHLQPLAVKAMKLRVGFATEERSFFNAEHIQTNLWTRLAKTRLQKLLYIYYNSRAFRVPCSLSSLIVSSAVTPSAVGSLMTTGGATTRGEEDTVDDGESIVDPVEDFADSLMEEENGVGVLDTQLTQESST